MKLLKEIYIFPDCPIVIHENLSTQEVKAQMARLGITYTHGKPHRVNMGRLNAKLRSNHPLGGFLKSLTQDDLEYLFKYFDVKGKKVTTTHLSNKLFGLSPQRPIHTAISALKANLSSCPPKNVARNVPITGAPFKGLALRNPNTTCYINAAVNALANFDMVRQILCNHSPDTLDFYKKFITELGNGSTAPKDPEFLRDAVHKIFSSLSDILNVKTNSAADLRTKFSIIFDQFKSGQHDSTEFILKLAQTNSLLGDLFNFTVEEKKRCRVCRKEEKIGVQGNMDIKTRNILNIMPTPNPTDIQSLINTHFESEERVGENKMECSHCKTREDADLTKQVGTPPTVLAVRISRDAIQFGLDFALTAAVTPNETIQFKNTEYRVRSIIEHKASPLALQNPNIINPLESGHYIAYLRHHTKWIRCDDSTISEQTSTPETGFVYFYEKTQRETPHAAQQEADINEAQPEAEMQVVQPEVEIQRHDEPSILVIPRRSKRKTKAKLSPAKTIVLEKEGTKNIPAPKKVYKKKKPAPVDTSSSDSNLTGDEEDDTSKEYRDRQKQIYRGMKKMRQNMEQFWQWSEPCRICMESWPGMELKPRLKICNRCANERSSKRETE